MLIDVTLPQLGESVSEGTISKWLVREGEAVTKDQPLVSIATDKADSDLPAPVSGRVAKLLAAEGDVVPVLTVIAKIEAGAAGTVSAGAGVGLSAAPGAPVSLPAPPAVPVIVAPAARGGAGSALATPSSSTKWIWIASRAPASAVASPRTTCFARPLRRRKRPGSACLRRPRPRSSPRRRRRRRRPSRSRK
jgi:pyruvate dehydrogenase E2 component (dihydrolipoamide acetyltransferase)